MVGKFSLSYLKSAQDKPIVSTKNLSWLYTRNDMKNMRSIKWSTIILLLKFWSAQISKMIACKCLWNVMKIFLEFWLFAYCTNALQRINIKIQDIQHIPIWLGMRIYFIFFRNLSAGVFQFALARWNLSVPYFLNM